MSDLRRKALAGAAQSRVPASTLPSRPSSLRQSTIPEDVESSGFEILEDEGSENEDGGVSVREKSSVPKSSSSRAPSSVVPSSTVPKSSASKVPASVAPPSTVPKSSSSSRVPKSLAPPIDAPSSVTPSMGLTNSKFRDPSMVPSSKAPSSKVPSSMVPSSTPSMALTNSKFRDASKVPGSMVPSSSREKSRIVSQVSTDDDEAPGVDEPSSAPPPSASKVPLPVSVAPSAVPASAFPGMSRAASQAPRSVAPSVSGASGSKVPSVIPSMKEPSKAPGSQAPSSKAPSVMPSMRDQTKAPSSRAPGSQVPSSKVPSAMPSMRDATKVAGSKLPSVMPSMRDRTKAPEDIPIPPSVPISFSEEKWSQIEKSRTSRAPMKSIFTNPGDEEIASKIATVAPIGAQEEQFQEMMQQLGSCMDKYTWVRREDIGGYLCKGGKHFTSFELIAEGKGGWHVLLEAFKFEKGLNPHGPFYGYPVFPSKAWATNKIDRKTGKKGAFFSLDRKASDGPAPENVPA